MNLYIKIFATFILPITLGLMFTLFSLNSVLDKQKELIVHNNKIELNQIESRFNLVFQNMQRDINILTQSTDVSEALILHDNNVLTNWGKSFLDNLYSTVIFMNNKNTIISRASDQYRFGDKLNDKILVKLNKNSVYKGIFNIDGKELLLYSKKVKDYSNKVVGTVILGITIDHDFLKHIDSLEHLAIKYVNSKKIAIYSNKFKNIEKETPYLTYIKDIDSLNRFFIQKTSNTELKNLENFKINILTFTVVICVIIIFLLYLILTNFLRPYKKIYNLLLDFANHKVDFKHIRNSSKNIAAQTKTKEIYHMARAIHKVSKKALKNEDELKKISYTDQLTKVLNRRKLDEILLRESYEANRYNKELSIVMIDIDHFKSINDSYGHQIGDKILKEFSTLINENLRTTDYFGRWGGEEFLIICASTNLEGTLLLTNKLRDLIHTSTFTNELNVTASFGVGEIKESENVYTLISRTDEALYKAKNEGRDRIETAD